MGDERLGRLGLLHLKDKPDELQKELARRVQEAAEERGPQIEAYYAKLERELEAKRDQLERKARVILTRQRATKDTFISHATADSAIATEVCSLLERKGVRCWIAPRDIPPGTTYANEIVSGIENSQTMIVLVSSSSNASKNVQREVEIASRLDRGLVPVRIQQVRISNALEFYLSATQWVDAWTPPIDDAIERVATAIQALTSSLEANTRAAQ